MRDPVHYLEDILESMTLIERFVEGMELDEFRNDIKTSDAVIKRFENIGEATKNIPADIKKEYQDIPWREMAGMRDKLVHFYFGIKFELVWTAIKTRIPVIKPLISKIHNDLQERKKAVNKPMQKPEEP